MSTTRRPRARRTLSLTVALLVAGLLASGSVAVLPGVTSSTATAASSSAGTAAAPQVSLRSSATTFGTGTTVSVRVSAARTAASRQIRLQRHVSGGPWTTVATRTVKGSTLSQVFTTLPPSRTVAYRGVVTTTAGGKRVAATTRTVVLHWKKPAVSATSLTRYASGHSFVVTGTAARTPAHTLVTLQRKVSGRWHTLAKVRTTRASSTYSLRFVAGTASSTVLRVVTSASRATPAAASRTWTVRRATPVSVRATLSRTTYHRGQTTTLSGTVSRVGKGAKVVLQERSGTAWKKVRTTTTTTTGGAYRFDVTRTSGTHTFRTVALERTSTTQGVSPTRTLHHETCTTMSTPGPLAVWFTDSVHRDGSAVSRHLAEIICGAAPHSTISVSLFILSDTDSESARMMKALRWVRAERGVHVRFVLETTHGGTPAAVISRVRQWATVTTCTQGCFNTAQNGSHEHDKLLAVSDTTWSSRTDPVVVLGSANWSNRQLAEYWQSAVMFYGDTKLYGEQVARFERMRTCAAGRCSSISSVDGRAWVHTALGNWGVAGDPVYSAAAGSGMTYQFFPSVVGHDNVAAELRDVTCRPGGTIRIAMFLATPSRARKIGTELGRLRKEGCSIKILVGQGSGSPTPQSAIDAFTATAGVTPQCVRLMHVKYTLMQGVTHGGRTGQTVLIDGSQNWTTSGLVGNDETVFTLATDQASSTRAAQIRSVASKYAAQWATMQAHVQKCGTIAP